jgi:carbamate kinase
VETVIDKELCEQTLARKLDADLLTMVTDVQAVYSGCGQSTQREKRPATVDGIGNSDFPEGSMASKIDAARMFVRATGWNPE